jgi:hypothetical protein
VLAVMQAGRPDGSGQRHAIGVDHREAERLGVVAATVQMQDLVEAVWLAEHGRAVHLEHGHPVAQPLAGDRDLVLEQLGDHGGGQHQPSTCGSRANSASISSWSMP